MITRLIHPKASPCKEAKVFHFLVQLIKLGAECLVTL